MSKIPTSSRCIERAPGSIPAIRLMVQSARIRYSPMTFLAQSRERRLTASESTKEVRELVREIVNKEMT